MSSRTKKISKNKLNKENKLQLELLEQYFAEYGLMNHYELWLTSRLNNTKPPKGLDLKVMLNPFTKVFRWLKKKLKMSK